MNALTAEEDYRLFCEERLQNPFPLFERLRREEPVHWCAPMNLWLVTRYDDVSKGLQDARLSSDRSRMYDQALPADLKARVKPLLDHIAKWIQFADEPDHRRLRKLVNLAFTPKMIGALRPGIEKHVEDLLEDVETNEPFDIIEKFCAPLPATVICEMLGIPASERGRFRASTAGIVSFSSRGGPTLKDHAENAHAALNTLLSMFENLVEERRRAPQGDLLSALVSAHADGDRLSNDELYAMCVFTFLAGHETTASGIASGILELLRHPEQFEMLKSDPDSIVGGAVEETLRFDSPAPRAVRRAGEDMEIGGTPIRAGQMVTFLLGAANRDPAHFSNPESFDLARRPNRHLAFGYGLHFCLGALLARLEMEISFRVLARRLPNLRLTGRDLTWRSIMGLRALESLPVVSS